MFRFLKRSMHLYWQLVESAVLKLNKTTKKMCIEN